MEISTAPHAQFLLGHITKFRADHLAWMLEVATYGDIVSWRYGPFPVLQLNHPDPIHMVLVTKATSFYKPRIDKQYFKDILGNGLLVNDGDSWRQQRKLVQPALTATRIGSYAEVMVSHTQQMLDRWHDRDEVDIWQEMAALTLGIVAKTLFDAEVGDLAYEVAQVGTVAQEVVNHRFNRLINPPNWVPTIDNRRARRASRRIDSIMLPIIRERRDSGEDHGDLLSMLLLAQDEDQGVGMSDVQVRDEAVTLFLAGHETTALALTWTWTLLSQNPAVERKLHEELDAVLGGRPPSFEDLEYLTYTRKVIQESMRLYPPAWIFARQAIRSVEIANQSLDKGRLVFISPYALHRDERWFPEPERFEPERFDEERARSIPKYAYLPFGAGPRVCVGNHFAMLEAQLVLATIGQHYRLKLRPDQDLRPVPLVTLRPRQALLMRARERRPIPA